MSEKKIRGGALVARALKDKGIEATTNIGVKYKNQLGGCLSLSGSKNLIESDQNAVFWIKISLKI